MAREFDDASSQSIDVDSTPVTSPPFAFSLWYYFDDVVNDGKRVADEVPVTSEYAEGLEDIKLAVAAGASDEAVGHAQNLYEANSQAMNWMDRAVRNLMPSARKRVQDAGGDSTVYNALNDIERKYSDLLLGELKLSAETQHTANVKSAWTWSDQRLLQGGAKGGIARNPGPYDWRSRGLNDGNTGRGSGRKKDSHSQ